MDKVVFFDRDGVINVEKNYLYKIEEFEFIDSEFSSFQYLKKLGYKFVIITNQSGIDRGKYTVEDFNILTTWMLEQFKEHGITIEAVNYCPHHPDFSGDCECRKPKIGMIKQAEEVLEIDYANSWLIGDKNSDIEAAKKNIGPIIEPSPLLTLQCIRLKKINNKTLQTIDNA